jgi:hypothetical protein
MPCHTDKTIPPKAVMIGTMTTSQIRPDETRVRSYPLRDGIHDEGLNSKAIQAGKNHDPNDRDHGPPLFKITRQSMTQGGHQLLYDAPGNQEMMTKTTAETMSHRMTSEPPL